MATVADAWSFGLRHVPPAVSDKSVVGPRLPCWTFTSRWRISVSMLTIGCCGSFVTVRVLFFGSGPAPSWERQAALGDEPAGGCPPFQRTTKPVGYPTAHDLALRLCFDRWLRQQTLPSFPQLLGSRTSDARRQMISCSFVPCRAVVLIYKTERELETAVLGPSGEELLRVRLLQRALKNTPVRGIYNDGLVHDGPSVLLTCRKVSP